MQEVLAAEKVIGMWHIKATENDGALSDRNDGEPITPGPITAANIEPTQGAAALTSNTQGLLQGAKSKRQDKFKFKGGIVKGNIHKECQRKNHGLKWPHS